MHDEATRRYGLITITLLVLLLLTMLVSRLPLGRLGWLVALAIAFAKAALVGIYFMHLKFEHAATRILAISGVLWLTLLIAGTMHDYLTRRP